jgi:hypothetical protein
VNIKNLFASISLLFFTQAHAGIHTCEEWKQKLPASYANDLKTSEDSPSTFRGISKACAGEVGSFALSYMHYRGKNALVLDLAARVGISGSTVSMVMVTGHQAMLAWKAAQLIKRAFEADKACFENHQLKRGMLEPVAHFYPETVIENWVRGLGCSEISRQVYQKTRALDAALAEKARKQRDWAVRSNPERGLSVEQLRRLERSFPSEDRELTENEKIYADKRSRMERPVSLLDVATDLMPCLKPEAIARFACGFVAQVAVSYNGKNFDARNVGLPSDFVSALTAVAESLPSPPSTNP